MVSYRVLFMLVTASFLLAGCSLVTQPPPPGPVPVISGEEALSSIWLEARQIRSLEVRARVRITEQEKPGPWVNCKVWMFDAPSSSALRMRGFGPFGMSLFDILSAGGHTTVRISRSGEEYSGRFFSLWEHQVDAEKVKKLLILALKPWKMAETQGEKRAWNCSNDRICLSCRTGQEELEGGFRPVAADDGGSMEFLPLYLKSSRFQVNYSGTIPVAYPEEGVKGPALYPARIKVRAGPWHIRMELLVKSVAANSLSDESPVFSP